jgi:hypothetical protein
MSSPRLPGESNDPENESDHDEEHDTEFDDPSTPDVSRGPGAPWEGPPLTSPTERSFGGPQQDAEMADQD